MSKKKAKRGIALAVQMLADINVRLRKAKWIERKKVSKCHANYG